jgi:serine/threonine protein kinase
MIANKYRVGKKLGSGAFGEIYEGHYENNLVAIKMVLHLSRNLRAANNRLCFMKATFTK